MASKLAPRDQALYSAVDEVLHYVWDPIGVAGEPAARDEYYGYLPKVLELLQTNADEGRVADHLERIATERMGLPGNPALARKVARTLIDWKGAIDEKFGGA